MRYFRTDDPSGSELVSEIVGQLGVAVECLSQRLPDTTRRGVWGCIALRLITQEVQFAPLFHGLIGAPPPFVKWGRYHDLSLEKTKRFDEFPRHRTGWESRDDGRERYAGGVCFPVSSNRWLLLRVAVSGLSPDTADEAAVLWALRRTRCITPRRAQMLAALSNNPCYPMLPGK